MSDIISVEHLAYTYPGVEDTPGVPVFADLNLTIEEGSFVAVLGTNGCGKSTLAKHFNAILLPSGGKVYVCGIDTANEDRLIAIRRNVGMVFQNPDNQIVANVVEEDVAFGPENLGIASPEIRRRVDSALKQVDMYEYRTHAPHLLSGGQKQRIAIAGVIAMEPEVLILDEPTAGLDPVGRSEILGNIQSYRKAKNATIMMVSHSMEDVARLTDRLLVMNGSKLAMDAPPAQVFTHAEELTQMGLNIPQVTQVFLELKKLGLDVKNVYTIDQAAAEIKRLKEGNRHA